MNRGIAIATLAAFLASAVAALSGSWQQGQKSSDRVLIDNDSVYVDEVFSTTAYVVTFNTGGEGGFGLISLLASGKTSNGAPKSWVLGSIHFSNRKQTEGSIPDLHDMGARRYIQIIVKSELAAAPLNRDAVNTDPKHNRKIFENDLVRVVSVHFKAGESGPVVDKRPRVIILLDDMHAIVTLPDGHSEPRDGKAGTVYWGNAGAQATKNIGGKPFENIVVELKGK